MSRTKKKFTFLAFLAIVFSNIIWGTDGWLEFNSVAFAQEPAPKGYGLGAYDVDRSNWQVYKVTNTNDSGVGSLRSALEASGPRMVSSVLPSGTIINLDSDIIIQNGDLFVDGKGLVVSNNYDAPISVALIRITPQAQSCLFKNLRVIPKWSGDTNHDAVTLWDTTSNVVKNIYFQNCTFFHGTDETFSIFRGQNITIDRCIFAYSTLGRNSGSTQSQYGALFNNCDGLTIVSSIFANARRRNPKLTSSGANQLTKAEIVNCLFYNYQESGIMVQSDDPTSVTDVNIVNNITLAGPDTGMRRDIHANAKVNDPTTGYVYVYRGGNIDMNYTRDSNVMDVILNVPNCPLTFVPIPATEVEQHVFQYAGAMPSLAQDYQDRPWEMQVIDSIINDSGTVIQVTSELDYPHPRSAQSRYFQPRDAQNTNKGYELEIQELSTSLIQLTITNFNTNTDILYPTDVSKNDDYWVYGTEFHDGQYKVKSVNQTTKTVVLQPVDGGAILPNESTDNSFKIASVAQFPFPQSASD